MITGPIIHGDLVVHEHTGNGYAVVAASMKFKLRDGEWIDGVAYRSMQTGLIYARDEPTFRARFIKAPKA